jgi:hypothetical protein
MARTKKLSRKPLLRYGLAEKIGIVKSVQKILLLCLE